MLPSAVLPSQALSPVASPTFAGMTLSGLTQGSVPFVGAGGLLSQDNGSFAYDGSGHFSLGTNAAIAASGGVIPRLFITENGGFAATFFKTSANANGSSIFYQKARGSISSLSATVNGDAIATHQFGGYDGTNWLYPAGISAKVNGAVSMGVMPIELRFGTGSGSSFAQTMMLSVTGGLLLGSIDTLDPGAGGLYLTGTAVKSRSYNSFTDPSNGEWAYGVADWGFTPNVATYGTDKNGTGSIRNLQFVAGGATKLDYGVTNDFDWSMPSSLHLLAQGALYLHNSTGSVVNQIYTDGNLHIAADGNPVLISGSLLQYRATVGGSSLLNVDGSGTALLAGGITTGSATLHTTSVSLTNGAAVALGTLSNAPVAGNPTKWVPINDNGTTRYIPAW